MIQRTTELRHLKEIHMHELSRMLTESDCWMKLMEIIPKNVDSATCSFDGGLDRLQFNGYKYNHDDIRDIRDISSRNPGEHRSSAEIMLSEWSSSGQKESRATVGILLQLLVKANLFRAANYVASLLNEPPPARPLDGPAATVDYGLPSALLREVDPVANNSEFYPETELLNANAQMTNGITDNNRDFYTKFHNNGKIWSGSDNVAPIPAPRVRRSQRLLTQEKSQDQPNTLETMLTLTAATATMNGSLNGDHRENVTDSNETNTTQTIPKLSALLSKAEMDENPSNAVTTISVDNADDDGGVPIPLLSALQETTKSDQITISQTMTDTALLPVISALNLNGSDYHSDNDDAPSHHLNHADEIESHYYGVSIEQVNVQHSKHDYLESDNSSEDISNDDGEDDDDDDDDDDENSSRNLGSSNNNSSLTNITGTSGENSFELNCSPASNENIPLNVLQH